MKKIMLFLVVISLSACASLQTPEETNVAVSALLDEIQIAINEIDSRTKGSSLPPFRSAEVRLSTRAEVATEGSASLVLSGEGGKTTTDSNVITLELVPSKMAVKSFGRSSGHEIADYVIAAVSAVDDKGFLKLNILTVEAGLEVKQRVGGGIEVGLVGVSVKGRRSSEATTGNTLKMVFANPEQKR